MKIRKSFDMKITSDYTYSINFGTTATMECDDADAKTMNAELAKRVKNATKKDAAEFKEKLKQLVEEAPAVAATDPAHQATNSLRSLIVRMETIGI